MKIAASKQTVIKNLRAQKLTELADNTVEAHDLSATQLAIYALKLSEARQFLLVDLGLNVTTANQNLVLWPMLSAEAKVTGIAMHDVALNIIKAASTGLVNTATIEANRLKQKQTIMAATTELDLDKVVIG